jgi:hypothetical protein
MAEATGTSSRRSLLRRGLGLAAGAIGLGAVGPEAAGAATLPSKTELRLHGRSFHFHAPDHRAGAVPAKGERHSVYGELLDRPGGKVVGHFTAAHFTHDSPFAGAASSLEIHTFNLTDGTIHGLGSAVRGAEGHFAVLGGTGRYAGARGSYVARIHVREHGGNGTAAFHLTLAG